MDERQYHHQQYLGTQYTGGSSGAYHGYVQQPPAYSYGTGHSAGAYGNSQANYYSSTSYPPAHATYINQQQPTTQNNYSQSFPGTSHVAFGDHQNSGVPNHQQNSNYGHAGYSASQTMPVVPENHVTNGYGEESTLDPRYQVQSNPGRFFTPGRVFCVLWHENVGRNGTDDTEWTQYSRGKFSEPIYSNIRRMVVVKKGARCALCSPIHTYSRQGTRKPGVHAKDHAVIHMAGTEPFIHPNETAMIKRPLEVEPASFGQTLHEMSRINFGKVHTIEHNIKVMPVGKITEESMPKFLGYAKSSINI